MAEQSIDKLTLDVEVTAKNTSEVFGQLKDNMAALKSALASIDTKKLAQVKTAAKAAKIKIDTSDISKAEKEVSGSVNKIGQMLAGLKVYADSAMGGDKSSFSSFERQALKAQATIAEVKKQIEQLGNVNIKSDKLIEYEKELEDSKAHIDSLVRQREQLSDTGGPEYLDLTARIENATAAQEKLNQEYREFVASGKATIDPFAEYEKSLEEMGRSIQDMGLRASQALESIRNSENASALAPLSEKLIKDIPAGLSHVQSAFAGLGKFADAALNGDKSALTSFERKMLSLQSELDTLKDKLRQLSSDSNVPPDVIDNFDAAIKRTTSDVAVFLNYVRAATGEGFKLPTSGIMGFVDKLRMAMGEARKGLNPKADAGPVKKLSKEINTAKANMISFSDAAKKGLKFMSLPFVGIGKILGGITQGFKNATDKGLMKFLKYGFGIRSVYVLFRRLRKAVTESFGDLQTSGAFFETTRANVEALKTSLATLKFQFGAAFEPIFNAVAPALQALINYLITAANVISAFMAKLTGKSTYSKVASVTLAAKDNLGGAAKNAKELNKQLQKFDELNNLTTNNGGGGGGGSGGADGDHARYTEEAVDSVLGDFGERLADMIRSGNWKLVGLVISDKLSDALENIDWPAIKQKAGNFGHNLAEFLNGLINPRLFSNIGTTIGESINTGLTFFNEWGKGMNWQNVGVSLAIGFDSFVQTGWIGNLGETLHTWIAGGLDAANAFFEAADFEELGKQLAEFIGNLNIPELASKLKTLAKNILKALADAISGLWNDLDSKGKLVAAIAGMLGSLVFLGKLSGLASKIMGALGGTTFVATSGVAGAIGTALSGLTITLATLTLSVTEFLFVGQLADDLLAWIYEQLGLDSASKWQKEQSFTDKMLDIWDGFKSGNLGDALSMMLDDSGLFGDYVEDEIRGPSSAVKNWLRGYEQLNEMGVTPQDVIDDTVDNIRNMKGIWEFFTDTEVPGGLTEVQSNIGGNKSTTTTTYKGLSKTLDTLNKKFKTVSKTQDTFLKTTQKGSETAGKALNTNYNTNAIQPIGEAFNTVYDAVNKIWSKSGEDARKHSTEFTSGFNDLPGETSSRFGEAYKQSTNKWTSIGNWVKEKANVVNNGFNGFPGATSAKFSEAYSQGTSKFNSTGTWIQGVKDTITKKIGEVPGQFNSDFKAASDNATKQTKVFTDWFTNLKLKTTATLNAALPDTQPIKDKWNEIAGIWKDFKANASMTVEASTVGNFDGAINSAKNMINAAIDNLNTNIKSVVYAYQNQGMKIKYYGIKHIAARGGIVDMATPLIAGEAGTEAIVPLENHTEWLGKMANLMVGEMVKPQHLNIASTISRPSASGADATAIAEQNNLLREEVQLLRQIAAKEFSVGSREVYDAVRKENDDYVNRMGYSPLFS